MTDHFESSCPMCGSSNEFNTEEIQQQTIDSEDRFADEPSQLSFAVCRQCGERLELNQTQETKATRWETFLAFFVLVSLILIFFAALLALSS
ncbi:MAG: hypothetical protein Tsb009_30330 [Planctomycetaceae bacterium]